MGPRPAGWRRCIEDERRLLIHLPKRWGTSRVWRSRAADEGLAGDLIEETVDEVRAAREKFRGRGAYGALVLERCRVGGHLGATLALTKANIATSGSILKRAGFRPVGTERRHVLEIHR